MTATAIAAGAGWVSSHTCAILADGTVRCWGANDVGQLGDGTLHRDCGWNEDDQSDCSPTPVAVLGITTASAIAAGGLHTCAILADRTVRCWGANLSGQLGDGTTTDRPAPVAVVGITTATEIAAGIAHTCAVLADGSVRCWGGNRLGQLGDGTLTGRTTPVAVPGITTAIAIAAAGNHTCALLADGTIRCWGSNYAGQLGDGTLTHQVCPADQDTADCSPRPVTVRRITTATAIAVGVLHGCAVLTGDTLRCWGSNASGQLGDGTRTDRPAPVAVLGLATATAIAAGDDEFNGAGHSCAILADETVRCWGSNEFGQLGDGWTTYRSTPVAVVFDTVAPTTSVPRAALRVGQTLIGSAVQVRVGWTGAMLGGPGSPATGWA